jgi:hypothetical protein
MVVVYAPLGTSIFRSPAPMAWKTRLLAAVMGCGGTEWRLVNDGRRVTCVDAPESYNSTSGFEPLQDPHPYNFPMCASHPQAPSQTTAFIKISPMAVHCGAQHLALPLNNAAADLDLAPSSHLYLLMSVLFFNRNPDSDLNGSFHGPCQP